MKKTILASLCLLFSACGGAPRQELRIFNWIAYIPEDIFLDFEKETGIRVIEDAVGSNEELYAKVRGSAGYDIVVPGLNYAQIMINEGLIAPFDKAKIPNYTNLDPVILKKIEGVDPNQEYLVPFAFGPTVIAYNTAEVSEDIKGFEIFENPKYKGRMTMMNDMREAMIPALKLNGYPSDTSSPEAMKIASAQIRKWKQNLLRFDSDNFHKAFADGETVIAHGFVDTIRTALSEEKLKTTKFVVPAEGAVAYLDSMVLLKQAKNPDAAMQFMDFIHRPEIYARIIDFLGTPGVNAPARELAKRPLAVSMEDFNKSDVELLTDIGDEAIQVQSKVWEEILAE